MLITQFYNVLSSEAKEEMTWTVNVELNEHHSIYQGHFPGNPVLPGVCALQIIKECFAKLMDTPFQYAQVNSCKFLSPINPAQTPRLQLDLTAKPLEENHIQLVVEGKTGETYFIKLKAILLRK